MQAEGELVRLPAAKDEPPDFAAFFADEHRGLFKVLYFVTGNRADAAELMQDASFLGDANVVVTVADGEAGRGNAASWAFGTIPRRRGRSSTTSSPSREATRPEPDGRKLTDRFG